MRRPSRAETHPLTTVSRRTNPTQSPPSPARPIGRKVLRFVLRCVLAWYAFGTLLRQAAVVVSGREEGDGRDVIVVDRPPLLAGANATKGGSAAADLIAPPPQQRQQQQQRAAGLRSNGTAKAERCTILLQWGDMRTASTTQFMLLCAVAEMRGGEGMCGRFGQQLKWGRNQFYRRGGWTAWKYHPMYVAVNNAREAEEEHGCRVLWFSSSPPPGGRSVLVYQNRTEYFAGGFDYLEASIRNEYAKSLSLGPEAVELLVEYMRAFEPVRRCCGFQASQSYMRELREQGPLDGSEEEARRGNHTCFRWDVAALEKSLLGTRLARRYPALREESNRPPHRLDGSYCKRVERLIRKGVSFDAGNVETVLNMSIQEALTREANTMKS